MMNFSDKLSYLIIGKGRVAKHMAYYLNLLELPFQQWSSESVTSLTSLLRQNQRILLLISDSAIHDFLQQHAALSNHQVIHFSGALIIDNVHSAHPLTSFTHRLFETSFYPTIPFFIEQEGPEFQELLPGFPNPAFAIPRAQKSLYHCLAVLSGNFTTLLWQKLFSELEDTFNIPKDAAFPYLQSIAHNLQADLAHALTGPLVRNDHITITKNLEALGADPFAEIYRAFVKVYQEKKHARS